MVIRNGIPSESIILETTIAIFMTYLSYLTFRRYLQRKRLPTYYLFLTIGTFTLAVFSSDFGKLLDYFFILNPNNSYSGFTIIIAYCFVALANTFLYAFIESIYLSNNRMRKFIIGFTNGVLIGLILAGLKLEEDIYSDLFLFLVPVILLAFFIYVLLFYLSIKEIRNSDTTMVRAGFLFIGLFGFFMSFVFILFGVDVIKIQQTGAGYNPEYYFAWISAALASLFGYLGYIMPDWLRNLLGGN